MGLDEFNEPKEPYFILATSCKDHYAERRPDRALVVEAMPGLNLRAVSSAHPSPAYR